MIKRHTYEGALAATALLIGAAACGSSTGGSGHAAAAAARKVAAATTAAAAPSSEPDATESPSTSSGEQPDSTDSSDTPTPSGVPLPAPITVNKSVWYGGTKITIGKVTSEREGYSTDAEIGVHVPIVMENLSEVTSSGFPSSSADLAYDDTHLQPTNLDSLSAEIPGKTKGKGELDYTLPQGFDLAKATLTIGTASYQQVHIPFGAGKFVDLKPRVVPMTGKVKAGPITLKFSSAEVRADDPDSADQAVTGRTFLVLHYIASSTANSERVSYEDMTVKLPDGTGAVGKDGTEGVGTPQRSYIQIPSPAPAGKYQLTYTQAYDQTAKAHLTFTMPAS